MEIVNLEDITPASYNPRKISEESFSELQGSLKTLGFIVPIIVNKTNMTIVAGHQRTKACAKVGISKVPAYFVEDVSIEAEALFNQVHNGIESEPEIHGMCLKDYAAGEFHEGIAATDFIVKDAKPFFVRHNCKLINEYGNVLCAVLCDGEIVFGNNYIRACQLLDTPCNVYVLESSKRMMFDYYFHKDYGYFSYDHLEKADFVQGRAQMTNKHFENSLIYRIAMPFITAENNKNLNILDFGCGKAFSITHMKKVLGYHNAIGIEFFNHNRVGISIEKGHEMINALIKHVKKHGLFDYVICDSVLNSVNSQEAEDAVLATLILFCKIGGSIFFCGRRRENRMALLNAKRTSQDNMYDVSFLDENGLTAKMTQGQWFYQKYLTKEQVDSIIERFGFDVITRKDTGEMWNVGARKVKDLSPEIYMAAIDFEFNMRLPNNKRYGRHNDIRKLMGFPEIG